MELSAVSEMNIPSVIPMPGGSTLHSEGTVGKYRKVFSSVNLYSNSATKNAGNFDGEARALMEGGEAIGASLQGIWKRDGNKITIHSLDDASNGDQNYTVIEVDMISMKSVVKVHAL